MEKTMVKDLILAILVLFVYQANALAQTRDIYTIIEQNIVNGLPDAIKVQEDLCLKALGGTCSLASMEELTGVWEKKASTKSPSDLAPVHIFAYSNDGKTAENDISMSYAQMEQLLPGFIYGTVWQDFKIEQGLMKISAGSGFSPAMVFIFKEDVPQQIIDPLIHLPVSLPKGSLLLVYPEEITVAQRVADLPVKR